MVIIMYKLYELPYSYSSLEPFIDTHTMGLHYNKHLKKEMTLKRKLLIIMQKNY